MTPLEQALREAVEAMAAFKNADWSAQGGVKAATLELAANRAAIDLIDDHADELLSRVGGWIPVSERLPEVGRQWDGKSFVVALESDGVPSVKTTMGLVNAVRVTSYVDDDGNVEHFEPPTHWMPLPAPPQEARYPTREEDAALRRAAKKSFKQEDSDA